MSKLFSRRNFVKLLGLGSAAFVISPAQAFANNANSDTVTFTQELAKDMAQRFADTNYADMNLSAASAVKYFDTDWNACGYIVDYTKNEIPFGYIILDASIENTIAEYSIGEEVISPFRNAVSSSPSRSLDDESNYYPIRISPIEYCAVNRYTGDTYTNNGLAATISIPKSKDPSTWNDVSIGVVDLYRNHTITASGQFEQWNVISESEIEAMTGRYACVVTACFYIACDFGLASKTDSDQYLRIWDYTGTTTDHISGGITYGTTNVTNGMSGFASYCSSRGKAISQRTTSSKPDFSEYVSSIEEGRHCLMHGWLWTLDSSGNYVESGHTMSVIGYARAINKETGDGLRVLQVLDGWYRTVRYINFDFTNYANFRGTFLSA